MHWSCLPGSPPTLPWVSFLPPSFHIGGAHGRETPRHKPGSQEDAGLSQPAVMEWEGRGGCGQRGGLGRPLPCRAANALPTLPRHADGNGQPAADAGSPRIGLGRRALIGTSKETVSCFIFNSD